MTEKELFINCLKELGMEISDLSVVRIRNYSCAKELFRKIGATGIQLGMDMYSGTCSGDVNVTGSETNHIGLIENDNGCTDLFKFKEMIIIFSNIRDSEVSPSIFIESDIDTEWLHAYGGSALPYVVEGRYLGLINVDTGRITYDSKEIEAYINEEQRANYDPYYTGTLPKVRRIVRNTKRKLAVYINLQECHKRMRGNIYVYKNQDVSCDDIAQALSDYHIIEG